MEQESKREGEKEGGREEGREGGREGERDKVNKKVCEDKVNKMYSKIRRMKLIKHTYAIKKALHKPF